MRVAAVFACVQKIAGAIATLPIHVYRTDGDVKARMPRDALWYKLNESPSPMWTAASHWESVSTNQLLRGDSYALPRFGENGSLLSILPLPWGIVSPLAMPDGSVRYYLNLTQFGMGTSIRSRRSEAPSVLPRLSARNVLVPPPPSASYITNLSAHTWGTS